MPDETQTVEATGEDPEILRYLEFLALKSLRGDVRDSLLEYLKVRHNPLPWNLQGEEAQKTVISFAEQFAHELIRKVVAIVAAEGRPAASATINQAKIKDKLVLEVHVAGDNPLRHELTDAVGTSVTIVLNKVRDFMGQRGGVLPTPDQGSLLPGDPDPNDEPPGDLDSPPDSPSGGAG